MIKSLGAQMLEATETAGGEWAIYIEDLSTGESFMHKENQPFYAAKQTIAKLGKMVFDRYNV
ncbi:hypothetical protein [Brevibacillus laterosporus]|uniref:Uncharacterized protein n=1 Tax=Brevibacillus laterosporus TaxID=1465 RepID=A0AAP3DCU8_BRELA|nr:hypothetical protein [Brevibacillus laterosporus]MCR8978878.1 hypothetical protein [Brevibacillus laterosporus]MCZ0806034.1 hypothetical protein [Brevibacillus laterosporus]MCZ0824219.1 hypothetical protein [Brevibacillus laterosporus]MCZ0848126.1 hypothetical protein [Brevibacillus laterosporus]